MGAELWPSPSIMSANNCFELALLVLLEDKSSETDEEMLSQSMLHQYLNTVKKSTSRKAYMAVSIYTKSETPECCDDILIVAFALNNEKPKSQPQVWFKHPGCSEPL
jgi:hypothetical protein